MTSRTTELLARYERAVLEEARAIAQVKYLEMEAKLLFASCPMAAGEAGETGEKQPKMSQNEAYIAANWQGSDDDDWAEFLRKNRGPVSTDVARRFLEATPYQVRELLKSGILKHGLGSTPKAIRIDPISIVELLRFGEEHIRQCQSPSDQNVESGP